MAESTEEITVPQFFLFGLDRWYYQRWQEKGKKPSFNIADYFRENCQVMDVKAGESRMIRKACYRNSFINMGYGLEYVEGYVTVSGLPISHAWNKRKEEYVDYTLIPRKDEKYVGIVIPRER